MAIDAGRGLVLLFFRLRFVAAVSAAGFGEKARVAMLRDVWMVMCVSLYRSQSVTNRVMLYMLRRFVLPFCLLLKRGPNTLKSRDWWASHVVLRARHRTNSRQLLTLVTLASYEFQLYTGSAYDSLL